MGRLWVTAVLAASPRASSLRSLWRPNVALAKAHAGRRRASTLGRWRDVPTKTIAVAATSKSPDDDDDDDKDEPPASSSEVRVRRCGVSSDGRFVSDSWLRGLIWSAELRRNHNDGRIFDEESPYQRVEVVETVSLGRALVLDGALQCAERDEAGYHEMLAHVPLLRSNAYRYVRVLIVGGGDGGVAREVLRHELVQAVDLVEIDPAVVRATREHMPRLWPASLSNDARLTVHYEDAAAFVRRRADMVDDEDLDLDQKIMYDVILVDASDPVGPGAALYEVAFYDALRRLLNFRGAVAVQAGSFFYLPSVFRGVYHRLLEAGFARVEPYACFTAVYPGGLWNLVCATIDEDDDPARPHPRRADLFGEICSVDRPLEFYDADAHSAAFALPPRARAELAKGPPDDIAADLREIYDWE